VDNSTSSGWSEGDYLTELLGGLAFLQHKLIRAALDE
jgi:hypothetical protein